MRKEIKFFKHLISSIGLIVISLFLLIDLTYSKDLYQMTVGEITKNSKESNPMNYIADYINENGYIDGSAWDVISASEDEYETQLEEEIYNNAIEIKNEIKKGIKDNNKLRVIIYLIIMILLIFGVGITTYMSIKKKKLLIINILFILFLILVKVFNPNKAIEKDYIIDYLNKGILDKKISSKIDDYYSDEFINKMCDRKYGIGMSINDFIVKCYYAVKCKANNEKVYKDNLDHKYAWGSDSDEYEYSYYDKLSLLDGFAYEYDEEGSYGASVSYRGIKDLYNKITEDDIEDYNNGIYLEKLVKKLKNELKHSSAIELKESNENIIDYLGRLGAMYFWNGNVETPILKYFKDWYIDGDDRTIKLPYDYYLYYKKENFVKRNIKEFVKSNINDKSIEIDNGTSLIVYYNDNENNTIGDFIKLNIIEEEGQNKWYFNKSQLLYDIRKPVTIISPNNNIKFIDNGATLFYDDLGKYGIVEVKEEDSETSKDIKKEEYYSDGITKRVYTDDGVLLEDWTDKSESIKKIIENDELVEKSFGTNRDWQIVRLVAANTYDYSHPLLKKYKFSANFKNKYKSLKDVARIGSKSEKDLPLDISVAKTDKVIKKLILKDTNEEKICIFNVHWTDDGMIDDIEYYIVPEEKMNLSYEEMYQLAFND